jgi:hypothetical protein
MKIARKFIGFSLIASVAALIAVSALAGFLTSTQSGDWKAGTTWGGVSGKDAPGGKAGRTDDATVAKGHNVNWQGKGRGKLNDITVKGGLRGVGNTTPIVINPKGNVTVDSSGSIGGAGAGNKRSNRVHIKTKKSVNVKNGSVWGSGENGSVTVEGEAGVNVGPKGVVESYDRGVKIESKSGSVTVAAGGKVVAKNNVEIKSGNGKPTQVAGSIESKDGNIVINKGKSRPGNVKIDSTGSIKALNKKRGEIVIHADTLFVEGKIEGRTIKKKCKVVILKTPPGSIKGDLKGYNKIDTLLAIKKKNETDKGEQSEDNKIIGEQNSIIDLSAAPGAIEAFGTAMVATGTGGTIDMTGNPPGLPVIECPGPIEIYSDNILLDAGVTLVDICGPGPVISGPSQPIIAVATYCSRDTVGYPGYHAEIEFEVTNMGLVPEEFIISVVDSLGWPYGVSVPNVFLDNIDPRDTTITIDVEVPPWAIPDADTNKLWLTATSTLDPGIWYTETAILPVADECELRDVTIEWYDTENTEPGDTADVTTIIHNTGLVFPDVYDVVVTDFNGWELIPPAMPLGLNTDEDSLYLTKVVIPPTAMLGDADTLYYNIQSTSCPGLVVRDTVLLTVEINTAAEPATPNHQVIEHHAYPNPFNPTVTIAFTVPDGGGLVRIEVFDVNGHRVRTVFQGPMKSGERSKVWGGKDHRGEAVTSGVYLYRITIGNQTVSGKLVLTK